MCAAMWSVSGCSGSARTGSFPSTLTRRRSPTSFMRICRKRSLMALKGGQAVIVDGVHAKPEEREAIAACGARPVSRSPEFGSTRRPIRCGDGSQAAAGDISDATAAVLDEQLRYDLGPQSFTVVDASKPLDEVIASCLASSVRTSLTRLKLAAFGGRYPVEFILSLTLSPDSDASAEGSASRLLSRALRRVHGVLTGSGRWVRVGSVRARAYGGEAHLARRHAPCPYAC